METFSCVFVFLVSWITYINGACPLVRIANGRSRLRMRGRVQSFNCNQGYQLYGDKVDYCQNGKWTKAAPFCVAPGCSTDITIENGHVTSSLNGSVVIIDCVTHTLLEGSRILLCDGKNWNTAPPMCKGPSDIVKCDFENEGLCGWKQDHTDKFDWTRNSGATITGRTGPNTDHTFESKRSDGHYIYMEASSPRTFGDVARLLSPWYPPELSGRCFRFWYHMLGPSSRNDVGTLKVEMVKGHGSNTEMETMFWVTGNQGDSWRETSFYIPAMEVSYQLILAATRLNSYVSDIAVDDLQFYNCSAPTTTSLTTIPMTVSMINSDAITTENNKFVTIAEQSLKTVKYKLNTPAALNVDHETSTSSSNLAHSEKGSSYFPTNGTVAPNDDDDGSGELDPDDMNRTRKISTQVNGDFENVTDDNSTNAMITAKIVSVNASEDSSTVSNTFTNSKAEISSTISNTFKNSKTEISSTISNTFTNSETQTLSDDKSDSGVNASYITTDSSVQEITNGSNTSEDNQNTSQSNTYTTAQISNSSWTDGNYFDDKSDYYNTTTINLNFNTTLTVENQTLYYEKFGFFTETLIVCMGIGAVVITVLIGVVIVLIVVCRKKQKKYDDKYEEMKQFVETHYRSRYV